MHHKHKVRAKTLQELVYKNGQAGVTKATVSIVFDNRQKEGSPVGYADQDEIVVTRQVVLGGKNKYLINGHNAQKGGSGTAVSGGTWFAAALWARRHKPFVRSFQLVSSPQNDSSQVGWKTSFTQFS